MIWKLYDTKEDRARFALWKFLKDEAFKKLWNGNLLTT